MPRKSVLALPGLVLVAILLGTGAAVAYEAAVTTASVNARSGPGTGYGVVAVIPEDSLVLVHDCNATGRWCDTSWRDERGWVYSAYLDPVSGPPSASLRRRRSWPGGPSSGFFWSEQYRDYHLGRGWYRDRGLYNPLERYRDEYGSSWWYQNR
jgi:uncharacterized protein YraI